MGCCQLYSTQYWLRGGVLLLLRILGVLVGVNPSFNPFSQGPKRLGPDGVAITARLGLAEKEVACWAAAGMAMAKAMHMMKRRMVFIYLNLNQNTENGYSFFHLLLPNFHRLGNFGIGKLGNFFSSPKD